MSSEPIYYVYAYIRSKDSATAKAGTPYYIGKGKGNRAWDSHRVHNISVPNNTKYIIIIQNNIDEQTAFSIEKVLIKIWGKKTNNTGILHNKTDGGDGGRSGYKLSPETKNKISVAKKGKPGHKHTSQHKDYMREINTGRNITWGDKISNTRRQRQPGAKWYIVTLPNGVSVEVFNLKRFCEENNLDPSALGQVAAGRYKHHKGYKCCAL